MPPLVRLALLAGLLATLPAAAQAAPAPFGHPCVEQAGVRFCPTTTPEARVPSFDGTPMDVDVTLPAAGDGPFPTIVLLHGYGQTKAATESTDPATRDNNTYFAQHGYAVVTPTARGFGNSCGRPASRTADCLAAGWIHLADQRYEVRDTQELLGRLVDEGIVDPARIGVSGGSYGGGQSLMLAYLRDRVRLPDGSYAPWRSPAGTPLSIAAAAPVIPWSDLGSALVPNGRFTDRDAWTPALTTEPIGVPIKSYINGLYLGGALAGWVVDRGGDPQADLSGWKALFDAGEPYGAEALAIGRQMQQFHSALSIPGTPAPLLIANGWTDDLFPATQALMAYDTLRRADPNADVALLLGDFGHSRGTSKPATQLLGAELRDAFLAAHLRDGHDAPARGSVTATLTTCPRTRADTGPFTAASWDALHPGRLRFGARRAQAIRSGARDAELDRSFDPLNTTDACKTVRTVRPRGAAYAETRSPGVTLLGATTVTARVRTHGRDGQIAARLWDVDPRAGTQRLVDRGVYRLTPDQRGRVRFQLHGSGYRFARGHRIRLALAGSDGDYLRPSNQPFTVTIRGLDVVLPTHGRS